VTRIEWADRQMPVLASIRERFEREKPLEGHRISACLHVTTETANLARTLKAGEPTCSSAPRTLSRLRTTWPAALVAEFGVPVFAIKGEDDDTYYSHITAAVDHHPHMTMDDGADVIGVLHSKRPGATRRDHRRYRGERLPASSACALSRPTASSASPSLR
jgi:adenosylhomocysteinase